jgi:quercetin dioxygenase-like cupin family protein
MTEQTSTRTAPRILAADSGEIAPGLGGVTDRFMIDGRETDGRFSLVQHLFEPRALAGPMHRHQREDEYTYVLYGRIGASLGGEEYVAGPGDLIFKPRDQWHTFWNAGDEPAAVLEMISSAGLEELFREFGRLTAAPDPETLAGMAARYGCQVDFDGTFPIIERHRLRF